ncbi:cation efflux protein [Glomus cerebriforme]|uniref:Cation efflux protein n=1 Tax=Glomus cerebriforme TaxID=658196 RepID=A0A397SA48_9GLOM|nr:cation efflux protein [Glomus cerebriforme]
MLLSRQTRIIILLVLDILFFIVEISIGYWINSLAIIADSFHMLNDILSLIVAFYALKLASKTSFSSQYSYGWQRAEILGALINGVFLMALCFTIFIEAVQRFFDPPEIKRPEFMLGIGTAGLISNIIGLLLFHEHGHGHSHGHSHDSKPSSKSDATNNNDNTAPMDEILIHPAASRRSIIQYSRELALKSNDDDDNNISTSSNNENVTENNKVSEQEIPETHPTGDHHDHHDHHHKNLNMRGIFLHVLGDALGNIGVITTGLFIYYSHFSWRFYADPFISIILTIIIFSSAFPLVKSASFILLQKAPSGIPIDDVRSKIKELRGVLSVHELHIWQLSDTKRICSVHILLEPSANYTEIAADIRKILHVHGVHSITVQPEYVKIGLNSNDSGEVIMVIKSSNEGELELVLDEDHSDTACLLRCNLDPSCAQNLCCPPPAHLPKDKPKK